MDLKYQIESLLLVTNQPTGFKKLAELTKTDIAKVKDAVKELSDEYATRNGGIILQQIGQSVQMATAAENAKLVKDFVKAETTGELTRAALETLTIIAYRGPIGRAELEQIRGVNCAVILRNLMIRGLVTNEKPKGKMETFYQISFDFLKYLGLREQSELPEYDKLNSNESLEKLLTNNQKSA
jgi:segregation and condensation protein B